MGWKSNGNPTFPPSSVCLSATPELGRFFHHPHHETTQPTSTGNHVGVAACPLFYRPLHANGTRGDGKERPSEQFFSTASPPFFIGRRMRPTHRGDRRPRCPPKNPLKSFLCQGRQGGGYFGRPRTQRLIRRPIKRIPGHFWPEGTSKKLWGYPT